MIRRAELPPPASGTVYELTERGDELRATLLALARWGLELLPPPPGADAFTPVLLANAPQVLLRPAPGDTLEAAIVTSGETFGVHVADGDVRVLRGSPANPELTLRGEPDPLLTVAVGGVEPREQVGVELDGDPTALDRLRAMLDVPERLRPAGWPRIIARPPRPLASRPADATRRTPSRRP